MSCSAGDGEGGDNQRVDWPCRGPHLPPPTVLQEPAFSAGEAGASTPSAHLLTHDLLHPLLPHLPGLSPTENVKGHRGLFTLPSPPLTQTDTYTWAFSFDFDVGCWPAVQSGCRYVVLCLLDVHVQWRSFKRRNSHSWESDPGMKGGGIRVGRKRRNKVLEAREGEVLDFEKSQPKYQTLPGVTVSWSD